jgi:hypothetical protein
VLPWHETDFYTAPARASVAVTVATVALVGMVLLPGLILHALARMWAAMRMAKEAAAAEVGAESRVLRPGHTVLRGEVLGDGASPVVSIRIRQVGREYRVKNGVRHRWTEVDRQVVTTLSSAGTRIVSGRA